MFDNLKHSSVWSIFDKIRQIPRPSFKEEKIRSFIYDWVKEHNFQIKEDKAHNLVLYIPATKGYENAEIIAMQGHLDMVCEKHSEVDFNFETDSIQLERNGDWIKAKGTTLGADNGIGVALMMAAAIDPEIKHGPMEILLTATEEKGLVGARNLDPTLLKAKYMLNIDSEEWGEFCIGCAGGGDTVINLPIETVKSNLDDLIYEVKISGLKGGHSGCDIHKQRGNALKILTRLLSIMKHAKLAIIHGGNLRNAIPRESKATFMLAPFMKSSELNLLNKTFKTIQHELQVTEPNLKISIEQLDEHPESYMRLSSQETLLNLLESLPHGVVRMDDSMDNLVETSSNLASIRQSENHVEIIKTTRSSVSSQLEAHRAKISSICHLAQAKFEHDEAYSGWQPNPSSELVEKALKIYEKTFGEKPVLSAIHAGLECGIINDKYPNMQMISFGPDIRNAHSPDETLHLPSTEKCYDLLKNILVEIANETQKTDIKSTNGELEAEMA